MKRPLVETVFTEPRPKRTRELPGQPLPVPLASLTGQPASNFVWKRYSGCLVSGQAEDAFGRTAYVAVKDRAHIIDLWTNGYFGTVASSSSRAAYLVESWEPGLDFIRGNDTSDMDNSVTADHQWQCDDSFWDNDTNAGGHKPVEDNGGANTNYKDDTKSNIQQRNVDDVENARHLADCSDGVDKRNEQPVRNGTNVTLSEAAEPKSWAEAGDWFQIKSQPEKEPEVSLNLDLCEAFYLSYTLGCLVVESEGSELNLLEMWRRYCSLEQDFPYRYSAYHHLRAHGWVVRNGTLMAGDWVVYKLGPPFYHSSFIVRVEVVCGQTGKSLKERRIRPCTWSDLFGLGRLSENVRKELLIARIEKHGVQEVDFVSPHVLRKLAVSLRRYARWLPGEMRWDSKPEVPVQHH